VYLHSFTVRQYVTKQLMHKNIILNIRIIKMELRMVYYLPAFLETGYVIL
jgi:hypothetical protein